MHALPVATRGPSPVPAALPGLRSAAPLDRIMQLATDLGSGSRIKVTPMPGGASTRQFFRLELGDGRRAVAMYVPDAGRAEEASTVDESARRWPFLEVRDLLQSRGVRVPALLAEDCATGVLIVEDLGDDTIAAYIDTHPSRTEAVYQLAVRDLARAQESLADLPAGSVVRERAFDAPLLSWEIQHFREWGLEARGYSLSAAARTRFDGIADRLARRIAALPRSFVHRDYQSRNLMVTGELGEESLCWIDFQDALLGPRAYDLVALLQDSYQSFDDEFIAARIAEYAKHRDLPAAEHARVTEEFHLITVQRKLKDAGRFVFIEHKKGDPSYLPFVEPTIEKVRRSLERLSASEPDLLALAELLTRALPG